MVKNYLNWMFGLRIIFIIMCVPPRKKFTHSKLNWSSFCHHHKVAWVFETWLVELNFLTGQLPLFSVDAQVTVSVDWKCKLSSNNIYIHYVRYCAAGFAAQI